MRGRRIPENVPRIKDPFAVIPEKPENVEVRRNSAGMVHLRLNLELTGLKKRIADLLHYDYARKLELDEKGSHYYNMVDGETTLDTIIKSMMGKLGKNRKDTEGMVILFTRKLMMMRMIDLKVPENAQEKTPGE